MTGTKHGIILQDRDRNLLRELAVMRVIDREQAKIAAGFGSTTRANTRLLALTRAGFLRRFFLGTVGGARKALYAMSIRGADLVGVPYRGPRRGRDQILTADFFTAHQLEINQIYCMVKHQPIPGDARFVRWLAFHEPIATDIALIPDGYLEIETSEKKIAMFLEVDLGNESRSVWRRKVQAYLSYAVSGKFEPRFGHAQFRTVVVVNSERRLASLRTATTELSARIFWFSTIDAIQRDGFWSPIWQRPVGEQRVPLL
jgi:Replication-relaxation